MFSQADGHFLGNIPIPSEKNARRDLIGVDWGRVTPMYTALSENGGYPWDVPKCLAGTVYTLW